jgi:hypothetical protein
MRRAKSRKTPGKRLKKQEYLVDEVVNEDENLVISEEDANELAVLRDAKRAMLDQLHVQEKRNHLVCVEWNSILSSDPDFKMSLDQFKTDPVWSQIMSAVAKDFPVDLKV